MLVDTINAGIQRQDDRRQEAAVMVFEHADPAILGPGEWEALEAIMRDKNFAPVAAKRLLTFIKEATYTSEAIKSFLLSFTQADGKTKFVALDILTQQFPEDVDIMVFLAKCVKDESRCRTAVKARLNLFVQSRDWEAKITFAEKEAFANFLRTLPKKYQESVASLLPRLAPDGTQPCERSIM